MKNDVFLASNSCIFYQKDLTWLKIKGAKQDGHCKCQRSQTMWRRKGQEERTDIGGNWGVTWGGWGEVVIEHQTPPPSVSWGRGLWFLPQEWAREDTQDCYSLNTLRIHSKTISTHFEPDLLGWCLLSRSSQSRRVSQVAHSQNWWKAMLQSVTGIESCIAGGLKTEMPLGLGPCLLPCVLTHSNVSFPQKN